MHTTPRIYSITRHVRAIFIWGSDWHRLDVRLAEMVKTRVDPTGAFLAAVEQFSLNSITEPSRRHVGG